MKKRFIIGLAIIMAMYLLTGSILADQTMDQIEKTGKIVERGTYEEFFNNPKSERAKEFLKQIL